MLIEAFKDETQKFYLVFEGVEYFEGPLHWRGVKFFVGPPDECLEILRKIKGRRFNRMTDDYLLNIYRLYKTKTPELEVKILAGPVYKISEIPSDFR